MEIFIQTLILSPPQGHGGAADLDVVKGLIEDTVLSTQPAMVLSLRACASSPSVRSVCCSLPLLSFLKQKHDQTACCMIHEVEIYFCFFVFSLCPQASVDHLSVGLKSVPQTALARRLLLRQLRATLLKGQTVFPQALIFTVRLPADLLTPRSASLQVSGPDRGRCAAS